MVTLETAKDGPVTGWMLGFNALRKKSNRVRVDFTAVESCLKLSIHSTCHFFDHFLIMQGHKQLLFQLCMLNIKHFWLFW